MELTKKQEEDFTLLISNQSVMDDISDTEDLELNLGLDDLDLIELIMSVEKLFEITISDDDFSKIVTVSDYKKTICKYLK